MSDTYALFGIHATALYRTSCTYALFGFAHMDVSTCDLSGTKSRLATYAIPYILTICALWHPCHRAIPYILTIKKAAARLFLTLN